MSKVRDFLDAYRTVKILRHRYLAEFNNFKCIEYFPFQQSDDMRMPYYSVDASDENGEYEKANLWNPVGTCGLYKANSYCLDITCEHHNKNKRYVDLTQELENAKHERNRAFWAVFGIRLK